MKKKYPRIEKAIDLLDKTAVSATFKLLDCLAVLGETVFSDPYAHIHIPRREDELRAQGLGKRNYYVTVARCAKRGWIKKSKKGGKVFLKLTAQGKLKLLLQQLKQGVHTETRHDGTWSLVLFDIPEMASRNRDALRRFLRSIKFHQLQKSVYISPHPVSKEALTYLEQSSLRRFIHLMRVTEMDSANDLHHLLPKTKSK